MPKWNRWSQSAIDCYRRGCVCVGCLMKEITEQKCNMKKSVLELVAQLGAPPPEINGLFDGLTNSQNEVINAILSGANTKEQIANIMETTPNTVQTWLVQLYEIAQTNGLVFKAGYRRLPELAEFLKQKAQEKEEEKENEFMYDEDLKLEYANYYDPMIQAIKAGKEKLSEIAGATGIKSGTLSVTIDQFYKYLVNKDLAPEQTDKSKRQAVVDFIQSRLLDNDYSALTPVSQPAKEEKAEIEGNPMLNELFTQQEETIKNLLLQGLKFEDISKNLCISLTTVKTHVNNIYQKRNYHSLQDLLVAEFNNENEKLRSKITELENKLIARVQPKAQSFDFDAIKHRIQADIDKLTKKLNAIEMLERELT